MSDLKLSEAIRLGSMLHPQFHGGSFHMEPSGRILATCAIGAAIQAGFDLSDVQPWLDREEVRCPADCERRDHVRRLIAHLNDEHRWTREQIADWVQTIEDARSASSSVDHVELPQPVDA